MMSRSPNLAPMFSGFLEPSTSGFLWLTLPKTERLMISTVTRLKELGISLLAPGSVGCKESKVE